MLKKVANVEIEHPTTKKKLAKSQDSASGKITEYWTVANCCMTAVELQHVKNAKDMSRNMELHAKLNEQLENDEIVLTESEFNEVQAMVLAFPNFLQQGILFGHLFSIMQSPEQLKEEEAGAPAESEAKK